MGKFLFAMQMGSEPNPWKIAAELLEMSDHEVLDLTCHCGCDRGKLNHISKNVARNKWQKNEARSMSSITAGPDFLDVLRTAVTLMRREDPVGLVRELDVESRLVLEISKSLEFLRSLKPDLVVFPVTPHFFDEYVLHQSAEALGIRCIWFQPSSMAPTMLPRDVNGPIDTRVHGRNLSLATKDSITETLEASLVRFSTLETPPYITRQKASSTSSRTIRGKFRAIKASAKWVLEDRFSAKTLGRIGVKVPAIVLRFLQISVPRQRHRLLLSSARTHESGKLPASKYVLFALHYEPERTFVPEGGEDRSQLIQIAKLRELIEPDISIVVKEHSSQLSPSLQGYLGRSPDFYPALATFPGVYLNISTPLDVLLDGALWVVTGTGNMGIEAALRGVPVLHFGKPWWEGMPGGHHFDLAQMNPEILHNPAKIDSALVEEFLRKRVVEEMLPGGASESFVELKRRFPTLVQDIVTDSGKVISGFLADEINLDTHHSVEGHDRP